VSVIELIRAAQARREALYRYAAAHDHYAELEQRYVAQNRPIEAAGAHEFALIALKAYIAEVDDPRPEGLAP
jgi:hypothetical protein